MIEIKTDILENVDEKVLLIAVIGSLETLKKGIVTVDEVEKFIFSPRMIRTLKEKGCNERILGIIEKGCELEDIYSLLPDRLEEVINELEQDAIVVARNYEEYSTVDWLKLL